MSPAFQPTNAEALCSCILTTAQDTPTFQLSQHTAAIANTIKPDTIQRLGKCLLLIHGQVVNFFSIDDAIKKFFATLDSTFGVIKRINCEDAPPRGPHRGVDINTSSMLGLNRRAGCRINSR